MTCIAAAIDEKEMVVGGDSAGVGGWGLDLRADPKVFRNGPLVIGGTGSFRMLQLLQFELSVPKKGNMDAFKYMVTKFIPALRKCFKDNGFSRVKENVEEIDGAFIVAGYERIFAVRVDFQVAESKYPYYALGCGEEFALGAFNTLYRMDGEKINEARYAVEHALTAAEAHCAGVRSPFVFESMKIPKN